MPNDRKKRLHILPLEQQQEGQNKNETHLEVETVEELGDQCERGEEDLQGVDVFGVSLTQLNGGLKRGGHKTVSIRRIHAGKESTDTNSLYGSHHVITTTSVHKP